MTDRFDRGPIAWMTRHGVAPNILMAVLILGGLLMSTQVKQEIFPNFDLDLVTIVVPFPGASPEEVEEGIILAIEEEVRGLDGVDEVLAVASEGSAVVTVEILLGSDAQKVNQDIVSGRRRRTHYCAEHTSPCRDRSPNLWGCGRMVPAPSSGTGPRWTVAAQRHCAG